MNTAEPTEWIAFARHARLAQGDCRNVATRVKAHCDAHPNDPLFVFDARTSRPVELDLRGSAAAVLRRLTGKVNDEAPDTTAPGPESPRGPGRPKLGVVAREITLLPRHWSWLASQPGGASVALRKLVEHALRANRKSDRMREARDAVYRFMKAMAGDESGFEEASRALFATDISRLRKIIARWPRDVRDHVLALTAVMEAEPGAAED
jgi:uncharacterized protein